MRTSISNVLANLLSPESAGSTPQDSALTPAADAPTGDALAGIVAGAPLAARIVEHDTARARSN